MQHASESGLIASARYLASLNCDQRDLGCKPEVIIIHCISLPPGDYATGAIDQLFTNQLDPNAHSDYRDIAQLRVSAHFLVSRDGALTQYVPTHLRAWHAGESVCLGRPKVNNFSIGIELEGLDTDPQGFTDAQYQCLDELISCLQASYPDITQQNIFAHSDIAPGRKPDPGAFFDWSKLFK